VVLADRALEQLDADPERVPRTLLPRLRDLAAGRLRRLGVPATSPRARTLLGDELYDLLDDGPGRHHARPGATVLTRRLLDRLDEIDPPDRPAVTPAGPPADEPADEPQENDARAAR
jgi:hypothetical protein